MVICLGRGAYLHMAQTMPLPFTTLAPVDPDWFYLPGFAFVVPAHLGSSIQSPRGCKMVVVLVVVQVMYLYQYMLCLKLQKNITVIELWHPALSSSASVIALR